MLFLGLHLARKSLSLSLLDTLDQRVDVLALLFTYFRYHYLTCATALFWCLHPARKPAFGRIFRDAWGASTGARGAAAQPPKKKWPGPVNQPHPCKVTVPSEPTRLARHFGKALGGSVRSAQITTSSFGGYIHSASPTSVTLPVGGITDPYLLIHAKRCVSFISCALLFLSRPKKTPQNTFPFTPPLHLIL